MSVGLLPGARLRQVALDGVRFTVHRADPPRARRTTPVLLLHGIPQTAAIWRDLIPELASDRVVLAPDLKGLGTSEHRGSYDLDTLADELAALVLHEVDGRVDVVGHGVGGLLARALAARRPDLVRRLVVISAPGGPGLPGLPGRRGEGEGHRALGSVWELPWLALPVLPELVFAVATEPLLRATFRLGWRSTTRMDEAHLRHYVAAYSHPRRIDAMLAYYREAVYAPATSAPPAPALERALVVWGTFDPLAPVAGAEDVRTHLGEHAALLEVPGMGHFVLEEAPEVVVPAIAAFLREPAAPAKISPPETDK